MPNGDERRPLGMQGSLSSLGLDLAPKKKKPRRLSPLEQSQLIAQGEQMQPETMQPQTMEPTSPQTMGPEAQPTLLNKKKKKTLANLAKSTYGV